MVDMSSSNVIKVVRLVSCKLLLFGIFLLFGNSCKAQGSVRIFVIAGQNVPFVFNSIDKYQNGITYLNWTEFGIEIEDQAGAINYYWRLTAEAQTGTIQGSGANFLLLNTLRLTATDPSGSLTGKGATFLGPLDLTNAPGITLVCRAVAPCGGLPVTALVDEPDYATDDDRVMITYECGTTTSLLGAISDHYVVDIDFTVEVCFDPGPCGF